MAGAYLGQNFLTDDTSVQFIIDLLERYASHHQVLFEIGPGKAAITRKWLPFFQRGFLFEKDDDFKPILEKILRAQDQIVWWDVLEQDIRTLVDQNQLSYGEILVFWNIPYYITSPIFRKFFVDMEDFSTWIFLIQHEVGDKIRFDARKKSYLWWLLNLNYKVTYLKKVPAAAFTPAPKVDSCFVMLEKIHAIEINKNLLYELLDKISWFKRKTLWKCFKMIWTSCDFSDPVFAKRLEEVSWEEMKNLINIYEVHRDTEA